MIRYKIVGTTCSEEALKETDFPTHRGSLNEVFKFAASHQFKRGFIMSRHAVIDVNPKNTGENFLKVTK